MCAIEICVFSLQSFLSGQFLFSIFFSPLWISEVFISDFQLSLLGDGRQFEACHFTCEVKLAFLPLQDFLCSYLNFTCYFIAQSFSTTRSFYNCFQPIFLSIPTNNKVSAGYGPLLYSPFFRAVMNMLKSPSHCTEPWDCLSFIPAHCFLF